MLPTVADVLALDAVRRGAPRVIVGKDLLGAPVRWVHVIELAEAGHLLRGGELVLSTGIALPPDPDGLARYVAGLADAGVSALAVELGSRYVRELPRPLVDAAAAHGLPLIVLERETQFIAITEAVHAQILDAQVAELRAAQRIERVFTGLAAAGAGQDEIVRQASSLAGAPAILADLGHRVLACAHLGGDVETLLAGFAARSRSVTVPGRTGFDQDSGWLLATVGVRDADWGRLIFVLDSPPAPGLPALAERAAMTLALARLASEHADRSPERVAHGSVLRLITGPGYADEADLAARIVALGVPVTGRTLLPVVIARADQAGAAGQPGDPGGLTDDVAAACQAMAVPAICGMLGDRRTAAILALPPGAGLDRTGRALSGLAAALRHGRPGRPARLGERDVIGAGPAAAGLGQLRGALREAGQAAGAGLRCGIVRPFVRLADLRLAGLFYQLGDDPALIAFAERELGPLLAHDQREGTDLTGVLASYLACGGNKVRAAALAGLARPTLYERLRQIEAVLDVGLDQPETRLALHAALTARTASQPDGRAPR